MTAIRERFRGCLLGLAAGDAVGTTLEFQRPGSFQPIKDLVGGGPFNLAPGEWTDDTAMALCLAESLVEIQGFDPLDQMERYLRWYKEGYYSVKGYCFDIGGTTSAALRLFERTRQPYCGSSNAHSAGNGSLMRLAPVPMAYAHRPETAIQLSGDSSRTTHKAVQAVDACRYFGGLLVGALNGVDKALLLAAGYCPLDGYWPTQPLEPAIMAIAHGSFKVHQPPGIKGGGYVVHALEAALWAFYCSESFSEGCLLAANLGDDADTTAAIYGQLAGAYYGEQGIPAAWREKLAMRDQIESLADGLLALAGR